MPAGDRMHPVGIEREGGEGRKMSAVFSRRSRLHEQKIYMCSRYAWPHCAGNAPVKSTRPVQGRALQAFFRSPKPTPQLYVFESHLHPVGLLLGFFSLFVLSLLAPSLTDTHTSSSAPYPSHAFSSSSYSSRLSQPFRSPLLATPHASSSPSHSASPLHLQNDTTQDTQTHTHVHPLALATGAALTRQPWRTSMQPS